MPLFPIIPHTRIKEDTPGEMEGPINSGDDAGDLDDGVQTSANPYSIPPFAVDGENLCYGEGNEGEAGNSDADNCNAGDNMGYLEIHSSEDDNPVDMSVGEETEILVPSVGMKFQDEKEVFEFYKNYAYQVGFPVRKRSSKKGDDGVVRYVTYTCSREGRRISGTNTVLKPQPTMQTGCKARLSACSELNGIWRINTLILEHNHRTSPSKSRLYRCNREISARAKRQLEINDIAGIPLHKSFNSAVVEAGGYDQMTYVEKDCRNFIDKVRRLRLGEGDAVAIQTYFGKMQATSPGFFFSIDLDDDARLRNVFWADNRCRQACKEFGDIVTFDTTYLTNKYEMPFAPFVGVNHHGQSTLLGCGLVSNEDTSTFVWLFTTWLQCMHDKAPSGIITDQDRAMQNAVAIVFPNTKHRWCLWHILKKLPEKFGGHRHKASIVANVHRLVYDTQSCEEFEHGWNMMLDDYELVENTWLTGLYNERIRWVPCFLKTSFWAGMSTTQRSEGINAFFDGYVHSKTSLKQFVEQYERAMKSKVEKEFQADFKSFSSMVPCATRYEMEKQFQSVYTITKFKEFQEQFTGKVYCEVLSVHDSYLHTTYEVREDVIINDCMRTKMFKVCLRGDECDFECSCHLFEFRGIVCNHAIAVLIRKQVKLLPEKYILNRWRRDVIRPYTRVPINYDGWISSPDQVRYEELCTQFTKLADLVAHDEARSHGIMEWIEFQTVELSRLKPITGVPQYCDEAGNSGGDGILDPKYTKSKGAPKKLRRKGHLESGYKKPKTGPKVATNSKTKRQNDKYPPPINIQEIRTPTYSFPSQQGGTQESVCDFNLGV